MHFSMVLWSFYWVITFVDLMLVRAFKMIIFAMVFIKIGWVCWMSVVELRVVSIRLVVIISNVMCSVRVPWLMADSSLMISKYSSAFVVGFLVYNLMMWCGFSMDQAVDSWLMRNFMMTKIELNRILSYSFMVIFIVLSMRLFFETISMSNMVVIFFVFRMRINVSINRFMVRMVSSLVHWLMMS